MKFLILALAFASAANAQQSNAHPHGHASDWVCDVTWNSNGTIVTCDDGSTAYQGSVDLTRRNINDGTSITVGSWPQSGCSEDAHSADGADKVAAALVRAGKCLTTE